MTNKLSNIVVTTSPYGSKNSDPRELLEHLCLDNNMKVSYNETGRKYSREELLLVLQNKRPEIIVAGTEKYDVSILDTCPNLRMISRVGIGLDSVDLDECKKRGICVTYTPDAPTNAVAELTIGQIISLLRKTWIVDSEMRSGNWDRFIGREISNCTIGIIGAGRIGSEVIKKLSSLCPKRMLYTDTDPSREIFPEYEWSSKDRILEECDVISLHIPLTKHNVKYIGTKELSILKKDACILNTSRGGIIDEEALYMWLSENNDASASIDVFEKEPYDGVLLSLSNVLATPHLGSCSKKSRLAMELDAAKSVDNYLRSENLSHRVV